MIKHENSMNQEIVWTNGRIITMDPTIDDGYGLLESYDLITKNSEIIAIVPKGKHPTSSNTEIIDLKNALVTPGLIDCHTHLVFGGNRAKEWEMRLNGVPYVEIAKNGGGINSTVQATRNTSEKELYEQAYKRMRALANEGVTTIEAKSGYGLDLINERKQLNIYRSLSKNFPIEITSTLLSAHAVPPEYKGRDDEYIDLICAEILPTLWKEDLFEAVDVFCENVGFTLEQTQKVYETAAALNIPVKGHMEQLSNLGGSALVAKYHGLSVDHIEFLDKAEIQELAKTRTVATLLPLAFYFLRETKKPPIDLLRQYNIPIAISTDFNPGTSPFASIRLAMNAACVQFGLTPLEAFIGVTRNAAQALNKEKTHGQIRVGYKANFAIWDVQEPVEIFYELGHNPLIHRVFNGQIAQ